MMKKIEIEQSSKAIYSNQLGLALVGALVNKHTTLSQQLGGVGGSPKIPHKDVVKTSLVVLATGKSDFEAVRGVRKDAWFREAMSIGTMPSGETLRQRFERHVVDFERIARRCGVELLENVHIPVTELPTGHVALDVDVFCLDNSKTQKEGVSRTSQGYDGYAPSGASLGSEGWCLGVELREGSQHSQNGFVPFLRGFLGIARRLTEKPLLVRLDAAHNAVETRAELSAHEITAFIVKWNPRRANRAYWANKVSNEGRFRQVRPGKQVGLLSVSYPKTTRADLSLIGWWFGLRSGRLTPRDRGFLSRLSSSKDGGQTWIFLKRTSSLFTKTGV